MLACLSPLLLGLASKPVRRPAPALLVDRKKTWSNPQGSVLTQMCDDLYLAERPFFPRLPGLQGTDVGCKAVVVKLNDGTLWVHAPVGLDAPLRSALADLGPVAHVVTPNTEHQKFAPEWVREFPSAQSWACPTLREKKPGIWQHSLEELLDAPSGLTSQQPPSAWGGDIELCWVRDRIPLTPGIPFFNEVVFHHKPSKTLIVSDLWWAYPGSSADVEGGDAIAEVPLSSRLWKKGMDRIYRPLYNNLMRTETCTSSYETILGWGFEGIAPAHGEPIGEGGREVLRRHLNL